MSLGWDFLGQIKKTRGDRDGDLGSPKSLVKNPQNFLWMIADHWSRIFENVRILIPKIFFRPRDFHSRGFGIFKIWGFLSRGLGIFKPWNFYSGIGDLYPRGWGIFQNFDFFGKWRIKHDYFFLIWDRMTSPMFRSKFCFFNFDPYHDFESLNIHIFITKFGNKNYIF